METYYPYTKIKEFLATRYEAAELDSLFFDMLGENIETLGKNLTTPELAQEMVIYFKHREKLPNLLDAMKRTREIPYLNTFPEFQNPLGSVGRSLKLAEKEVPQDELKGINLPRVQKLGGFVIDEPPEGWDIQELTLRELLFNRFGTDLGGGPSESPFYDADRLDKREILSVSSKSRLRVACDPGISLLNGRPSIDIITEEIPVATLVIMPIERNSSPPAFIQQSFEHVFITNLVQILAITNLKSSSASTTRNTNRLRLTADFDQRNENVIVNGIPNQSLTSNITLIGIQGYTRDYILSLSYVTQATSNKAEIEKQRSLLLSLVDSFKLIKPKDVDAEERLWRAAGDERYKNYIKLTAGNSIKSQMYILFSQWKELDWNKAESKKRFAGDVKRLQKAIRIFAVDDEELSSLLGDLDDIAKLSLSEIKEFLASLDEEEPPITDPSS